MKKLALLLVLTASLFAGAASADPVLAQLRQEVANREAILASVAGGMDQQEISDAEGFLAIARQNLADYLNARIVPGTSGDLDQGPVHVIPSPLSKAPVQEGQANVFASLLDFLIPSASAQTVPGTGGKHYRAYFGTTNLRTLPDAIEFCRSKNAFLMGVNDSLELGVLRHMTAAGAANSTTFWLNHQLVPPGATALTTTPFPPYTANDWIPSLTVRPIIDTATPTTFFIDSTTVLNSPLTNTGAIRTATPITPRAVLTQFNGGVLVYNRSRSPLFGEFRWVRTHGTEGGVNFATARNGVICEQGNRMPAILN